VLMAAFVSCDVMQKSKHLSPRQGVACK
jgi:hypothetical protein